MVALGWAVKVDATIVPDKEFMVACTLGVGAAAVGAGPQALNAINRANINPNCFITGLSFS
jgi:hypothetical protein